MLCLRKNWKADQSPKTNLFFTAAITEQTKKKKEIKAQTVFTANDVRKLPIIATANYMHQKSESWHTKYPSSTQSVLNNIEKEFEQFKQQSQ